MASPIGKRVVEGDVSLERKKRIREEKPTDYTKCVVCQGPAVKQLLKIQEKTAPKLLVAMDCRQDETYERLYNDACNDTWVTDISPKWHTKCRNAYILEKSCKLAQMRRVGSSDTTMDQPECSTSIETPTILTRHRTAAFDAKRACLICNKRWAKGKTPATMVSTECSQQAIADKAKQLNREDILLRLVGHGHDMVANDISYHLPCMNAFRAARVSTGRSTPKSLHAVALNHLVEQLEVSLFQEKSGFLMKSLRDQYRNILRELGVKPGVHTNDFVTIHGRPARIHTAPAESTVGSMYCLPQALCEYARGDRESWRNR